MRARVRCSLRAASAGRLHGSQSIQSEMARALASVARTRFSRAAHGAGT